VAIAPHPALPVEWGEDKTDGGPPVGVATDPPPPPRPTRPADRGLRDGRRLRTAHGRAAGAGAPGISQRLVALRVGPDSGTSSGLK
jgi:hypothetical protein